MAYVSKEAKAKIVSLVKPILKQYGMKGSFSVGHHSTMVLKLKSGQLDLIGNYNSLAAKRPKEAYWSAPVDNMSVNVYWYHEHFDGIVREFLTKVIAAMKGADWFDKSDISTDFFHTAYYIDIKVGEYNKPYMLS